MPRLLPGRGALLATVVLALTLHSAATAQVLFADRAVALGIDITWATDYPVGDLGAGVALEDFDRDGDLDVFTATKRGSALGVYRNDGTSFANLSATFDLSSDRDIKQVLFADLDNDGFRDLILSVWRPNTPGTSFLSSAVRMYRGQSDGTFVQQHGAAIDSAMTGLATGIAAGDIDRDGDLDLYVSVWKPAQPDVTSRNRLLRNDGNWNFVDRGGALGVDDMKKSFQVNLADLTGDGWLDIVVAEDKAGGATYYENNGDGTFTDRTVESGLDGYVFFGGSYADGMGVGVGDYDNDFDLDVYITNIFDGNLLYRNNGDGTYTNVAAASGTESLRVAWGCAFFDCDNDIDQDLYVVDFGMSGSGDNHDRLYSNNGDGSFTDIAPAAGINYGEDGFGTAVGDVDGDGAVDVLLTHGEAPVRLLMNEGSVGNWVVLDLVGTQSNRDAIGAKVKVYAGGSVQFFEQHAGESYLSTHSHQMEIGLGGHSVVDSVVVWWPSDAGSGTTERWTALASGTRHVLVEGSSSVPVVTAPRATAQWDSRDLRLSWRVDDPTAFSRFELLDRQERVAVIEASADRTTYEFVDRRATAESDFTLVAILASSGEALRSRIEVPAAAELAVLRLDAPRPNPFNPRVTLRYYLPQSGPAKLRILDARGREVTRLPAEAGMGWHRAIWDGTDSSGRSVASGSYHVEIRQGGVLRSMPMSLVR